MAPAGKRGSIPSVDLRRRAATGGAGDIPGRRFHQVVLMAMAACAVAGAVAELKLSFTPHQLPAGSLSFEGGDRDSPAGWRVVDTGPHVSNLRDGDLITRLEGVPALEVLRSDSLKASFDEMLRTGPLSVTVVREPTFRRRPFVQWRILGYRVRRSGLISRSVVLDSAQAGLGLEVVLRALEPSDRDACSTAGLQCAESSRVLGRIPPEMDLGAAESALVRFDSSLRRLPAGTEIRQMLRGDDLALPVMSLSTPSGVRVGLERHGDDWTAVPAGASTRTLELVPRTWHESAETLVARGIFLMIAIVGLISLRARSESEAVRHFVVLCSLVSLGALAAVHDSWLRMWAPLSPELVFGDQYVVYEATADGALSAGEVVLVSQILPFLGLVILALGLVFHSMMRLLQTFPARDDRLVSQYGVPWRALGGAAALGIVAAALTGDNIRSTELLWGARIGTWAAVAVILGSVALLLQIVRLGVARLRQEFRGEEALQARLATSGLVLGTILLLGIWIFPSWYRASIPWTVELFDAMEGARRVLTPVAFSVPFLGFFLAISRRGLWNVDLIVHRATLYSALTGLFVVAWILLEVGVEWFLSNSLADLPVLGRLTPPLVAGGLVAVSQRSAAGFVAKRFRPPGRPLGDVLEGVSAQLEHLQGAGSIANGLVSELSDLAAPSRCDLFLADGSDGIWRRWSVREGTAGSVILASTLGVLDGHRHAIVSGDDGPVLLTKINPTGPPRGVLALGMRPGEHFYSVEDRQMLALFLGSLALRLSG